MTTREALLEIVQGLPENRLHEVLDFARFVTSEEERDEWLRFGRSSLAKAYGPDEPEYTEADLKPERCEVNVSR